MCRASHKRKKKVMQKLPPLQKVYEAWSALADGRVTMGESSARITSSNGEKCYEVKWEGDVYKSNDSASYWQGYAGYPIIAVLMEQGRLPYDRDFAQRFSGVDWNKLNKQHKRNYDAAAQEAFDEVGLLPDERAEANTAARAVIDALAELPILVKRNGRPAQKLTASTDRE